MASIYGTQQVEYTDEQRLTYLINNPRIGGMLFGALLPTERDLKERNRRARFTIDRHMEARGLDYVGPQEG